MPLKRVLWPIGGLALALAIWLQISGLQAGARGEPAFFNDFTSTYAASQLLRQGDAGALYDRVRKGIADRAAAHAQYGLGVLTENQAAEVGSSPWYYPPTYSFVLVGLGQLPYWLAFFVWTFSGGLLFFLALHRYLPISLAGALALAAPPTFYNLMMGQNGFFLAALLGFALSSMPSRPWLAGFFLGLASIKPNLGILIPFALIAGACWSTFLSAAATSLLLALLSFLVHGSGAWLAFFYALSDYISGASLHGVNLRQMASAQGAALIAGVPMTIAGVLQKTITGATVLGVIALWWKIDKRPRVLDIRNAILLLATPFALPSIYLYDLSIVTLAAAILLKDGLQNTVSRREQWVWAGGFFSLALAFPLAKLSDWQLAPLALAALLGLALTRYRKAITQ